MGQQFPDNEIELTQALVRIPSENPTGNEIVLAEYIMGWLQANGIGTEIQVVEDIRFNLLGRLSGENESPPLVYMAHMDTVPVGDRNKWSYDPFGAQISGENMYGRGTCDMKSGMASAMIAMKRIKEAGVKLKGDLVIAFTIDEEDTMKGSHALGEGGKVDANAYLLAMEPTGNKLNVAQKGVYWFRMTMRGKGAHAANPQFGADANRAMAEAMLAWYELVEEVLPKELIPHPLLGLPSLIVSKLHGGVKTNIVSEICQAEIDMRVPPIISDTKIIGYLEEAGRKAAEKYKVIFEMTFPTGLRHPVECRADSPLLGAFDRAYQSVTNNQPKHEGFLAYTDAAMLAVLTGNQHATVFGPGFLSDAHTTDEKVEVSQIEVATNVLERTALELLA